MIMKRRYEKPMAYVEEFGANEYIAACYYLACRRGDYGTSGIENHWSDKEYGGVSHSHLGTPATCADSSANRVITDDGGKYQKVQEKNGEQGWISGGFDYWIDKNNINKMDAGDIIYWYTKSNSNDRRWNHYGILELADKNHPNHS